MRTFPLNEIRPAADCVWLEEHSASDLLRSVRVSYASIEYIDQNWETGSVEIGLRSGRDFRVVVKSFETGDRADEAKTEMLDSFDALHTALNAWEAARR